MAFMVIDAWQDRGIGSILMRRLIQVAIEVGLQELTAEILTENTAMGKSIRKVRLHAGPAPRPPDAPSRSEAPLRARLHREITWH
jgi:GNAT superfamily N-acetyltransferase